MSYSKNRHQAQRWLQTAEEDGHAAQVLLAGGMYAQACFYAQQSAEKAIKALWYLLDADPYRQSRTWASINWRFRSSCTCVKSGRFVNTCCIHKQ